MQKRCSFSSLGNQRLVCKFYKSYMGSYQASVFYCFLKTKNESICQITGAPIFSLVSICMIYNFIDQKTSYSSFYYPTCVMIYPARLVTLLSSSSSRLLITQKVFQSFETIYIYPRWDFLHWKLLNNMTLTKVTKKHCCNTRQPEGKKIRDHIDRQGLFFQRK